MLVVDTNREHISKTRLTGVPVLHGSVLSRFVQDRTQLSEIGRFLALTPNDEVNALAVLQYQRMFSRSEVFQLAPAGTANARQERVSHELRGRVLFGKELTYEALEKKMESGFVVKRTNLTAEFSWEEFLKVSGVEAVPLFVKMETGEVGMFTVENPPRPRAGWVVFSLGAGKVGKA